MAPKTPLRMFALVAVAIPLAFALVWMAGFLYWHVTITRAISELERRAKAADTYADIVHPEGLHRAGSRAIPYLIKAADRAIADRDRNSAHQFQVCLKDVIDWADAAPDEIIRPRDFFIRTTYYGLEMAQAEHRAWWERHRDDYPAWWMWWTGKRFTSR